MQKIDENKVQKYGIRGFAISLPKVYAKDNGLEKGCEVEIFRDTVDGKDALIIIPKTVQEPRARVA